MIKKIVITGPESTGKSTLTNLLADFYHASKVEEYARTYLETLKRDYTFDDVIKMAKEQLKLERLAIETEKECFFLDTDLLVFKIWIKEKYNKEVDWIEEHLKNAKDKIYLLCNIDIPWELDKQREHPNQEDRIRLFNEYKKQLSKYQLTYYVVSGSVEERSERCKKILNSL